MTHHKNAGFATLLVIGGVLLVALIAAGGWYIARQSDTSPTASEVVNDTNSTSSDDEGSGQPIIQSHRSFNLKSDASSKSYQPNTPATYTFSITDDQGATLKDFATVHEKIMHIIIVRKDLAEFQHVHPEFNQTTRQFTLANLTFPSNGPYRIFADFTPRGTQMGPDGMPLGVTLNEDIDVGNIAAYKPQAVTESARTQTIQRYTVQLNTTPTPITAEQSTTLSFTVMQNGKPVTNLEKYLGALGHAVVLREGDLEFLHTHALDENVANQSGTVDFAVTFPKAGMYKVFAQFQHQGKVITTDFVVSAQPGTGAAGTNEGNPPVMEPEHGVGH